LVHVKGHPQSGSKIVWQRIENPGMHRETDKQRRSLNRRHQLEIERHPVAGLDGDSGRKAYAELIREHSRFLLKCHFHFGV
jgi:hypothetical protein